jgi:hypothetical protein
MTSKNRTYRIDPEKPSDMFVNALSGYGVGSPDLTCGWCGRVHLCPDWSFYQEEDGSWEKYCKEEYKENPEGVVLHYDCDGISGQEFNGIMFVWGCPCNGLTRYEKFIWNERDTIRNYLKCRIEQEAEWAEQELTKNKLAGISK